MGAEKQNDYGTLTPLEVLQNAWLKSRKRKKAIFVRVCMCCTLPDLEGSMRAMGCLLSYLAATMTLLRSRILILQLSYGLEVTRVSRLHEQDANVSLVTSPIEVH